MSKMGRYVFQLQEENEQYDYPDREGCTDAESHPLARVTVYGDGDRGLFRRPRTCHGQQIDTGPEAESDPLSKAKPPEEVQCRSGRREHEGI